jgi:hypothetical protein
MTHVFRVSYTILTPVDTWVQLTWPEIYTLSSIKTRAGQILTFI